MSLKLRVEDLTVESFNVNARSQSVLAADTAAGGGCLTYDHCEETMVDMCISDHPLCSLDCVEPSNRTDIVMCCG